MVNAYATVVARQAPGGGNGNNNAGGGNNNAGGGGSNAPSPTPAPNPQQSQSASASTSSNSSISIPDSVPAGGIIMIDPPNTASQSFYKIHPSEYITFRWNLTSLV